MYLKNKKVKTAIKDLNTLVKQNFKNKNNRLTKTNKYWRLCTFGANVTVVYYVYLNIENLILKLKAHKNKGLYFANKIA